VIGTVYGAQLGAAGHVVAMLGHGERTEVIAREGLTARDVLTKAETRSPAAVVDAVDGDAFDLVLVALRRENLDGLERQLARLSGEPQLVFFGNNPRGRAGLPAGLPGEVDLGFPGVGGTIKDGVAEYVRIAQQPTAIEHSPEPRLNELQQALEGRGFSVQRVADMSGWLAYHAVFVASIASALYRCGTDPQRLASDREQLKLMCAAITDGFLALRAKGLRGLPRNLAVLHNPALRPVAVRYWARTLRSPMGELAFAAHARHAEPEMRALADDVLNGLIEGEQPASLRRLLTPATACDSRPADGKPGADQLPGRRN
jgi:ketopantoate reductase